MSQTATRQIARQILGELSYSAWKSIALFAGSFVLSIVGAYVPEYAGLSDPGRAALFILLFSALLWITEAMPAFAVSLLVIGLEIAILGRPGGVFAESAQDWQRFVATWGSPLIWLFFGGFVLAQAAEKTGLDRWLAVSTLGRFGRKPALLLLGTMMTTAVLSMFISNTATATLMLAVLSPMFAARAATDRCAKSLLLGIALAANIGGMGTIIGSPPNAIAAGVLEEVAPINFAQWMLYAIPPVGVLLAIAWGFLMVRYFGRRAFTTLETELIPTDTQISIPAIQQILVVATFSLTVLMWLSSPWHGIPSTVISFLPICVLTTTGTLGQDDIRRLPWDVLLLIAGGLSLGVAIVDTGLSLWIIDQIPLDRLSPISMVLAFCYLMVLLSNLMSNTAAANILAPLALTALGPSNPQMVIPIALAASSAMCLPIATPPNAIVFGTRRLAAIDLLVVGLLMGTICPLVTISWAWYVQRVGWL